MKKTARETILTGIRGATTTVPEAPAVPQDFRYQDERERVALLDEFIDRLLDYRAQVTSTDEAGLPRAIATACQLYGTGELVVPADVPPNWLTAEMKVQRDHPPLTLAQLNESAGVLTGCTLAIAQTGTIILDGGARQGRRVLSLIPDLLLCVVYAEQVVGLVPEAIAALAGRTMRPITLLSGPSASSDIELNRVEGVHGPRTLHVFVVRTCEESETGTDNGVGE
jgi:L-lactate dehydrogenase complex protein LldG